jgi:hypothetical protein
MERQLVGKSGCRFPTVDSCGLPRAPIPRMALSRATLMIALDCYALVFSGSGYGTYVISSQALIMPIT